MAILTDLPNELLLSIIPKVSPLYIEYFALTCKRIYYLCKNTIQDYDMVRTRLEGLGQTDQSRAVSSNHHLAMCLKSLDLFFGEPNRAVYPQDLLDEIDTQLLQCPYIAHKNGAHGRDIIVSLLIIRLHNLRKLDIHFLRLTTLLGLFSQIVEAHYDPGLTMAEPLALARLTEANITAYGYDGMEIAILLAMMPSLRKLSVVRLRRNEPYTCPYPHRSSGVTELLLQGGVDSSCLEELIGRTHALQRFTYNHQIRDDCAKLQPQLVAKLLKEHAGGSLVYLRLLTQNPWRATEGHSGLSKHYHDLSLGSLRDFTALKTLVTCLDMFFEPRSHRDYEHSTGPVRRLVSSLPASLETLVLHELRQNWDRDVMRSLFQGFGNKKEARLPNLNQVLFVNFPHLD